MFPEAEQLRLNHDHFKDKIILLSQINTQLLLQKQNKKLEDNKETG